MPLQRIQLLKNFLRKLLNLQVRRDSRRRHTLGENDGSALHAPATQHGAGVHLELLRDLVHLGVVDGAGLAGLVVTQRGIGFDQDAFVFAVLRELGLLEVRVGFDLVHCGNDGGLAEEVFQPADVEVGDADGFDFAGGEELGHGVVGLVEGGCVEFEDAFGVEGEPFVAGGEDAVDNVSWIPMFEVLPNLHRPMHEVQVEVVRSKVFKRLVKCLLDIFWAVVGVPELASEKYLVSLHARFLDTSTDFVLVAVDGCAVNVTVTLLQCLLNGLLDLVRSGLPCPKAHSRDFGSSVQLEEVGERHGGFCEVSVDVFVSQSESKVAKV